jgi:hypothetical protein
MPIGPFNNETGKTAFVPIEGTLSVASGYVISHESARTARQAVIMAIAVVKSLNDNEDSFLLQRLNRALAELEAKHADQL